MKAITVERARELFLNAKKAEGMAPKTLRDYELSTQHFLDEMKVAEQPIDSITRQVFTDWVLYMSDKGKKPITQNKYLRDTRVLMYWCFEEFNLPTFKIKCVKTQEPALKGYTNEELKQLLKPVKKTDYNMFRNYCIVSFMLSTGARANTVLNIKVKDIDFKNHMVFYSQTKNKYSQNVPLGEQILNLLRELITLWRESDEDYLFGLQNGQQLSLSGLENTLRKFVAEQGVTWHSIHGFRHSYAREYIKNGGNVFSLQTILGHSDISVTKKYVRLFGSQLDISPVPFDKLLK